MAAVKNELKNTIKKDLMKKMKTTIAFKIFDQWWEEAKKQLKVLFYFNCFLDYYNFLNLHSLLVLPMKSLNLSNQLLILIMSWKVKRKM